MLGTFAGSEQMTDKECLKCESITFDGYTVCKILVTCDKHLCLFMRDPCSGFKEMA